MRFELRTLGLVAAVWSAGCGVATGGIQKLTPLNREPDIDRAAVAFLRQWRADVLARDVNRLAAYTWPESQPAVRKHLGAKDSKLYTMLYGGESPLEQLLAKITDAGVVAFRHHMNAEGTYVVGCYALDRTSVATAGDYVRLMRQSNGREVFCVNLVTGDGSVWYVDYTFAGEL